MSLLGTRVIRTEDPRFLTTGGVYTDDLRLPGACHVHFVRSALAHARITGVDVSAALAAPGVIAAFTGADLDLAEAAPPMPMINAARRLPLLARNVVRFVGEPLAVVVTEHRDQGEDAVDLVDVDYDPLPPVIECEVVVSRTIGNQRVAPAPMETRAAAAQWADGRLTAWIPNQGAQGIRTALAGLLGIDEAALRIITPDARGAFGAKFGADPEHAVVCWAARRLGGSAARRAGPKPAARTWSG